MLPCRFRYGDGRQAPMLCPTHALHTWGNSTQCEWLCTFGLSFPGLTDPVHTVSTAPVPQDFRDARNVQRVDI